MISTWIILVETKFIDIGGPDHVYTSQMINGAKLASRPPVPTGRGEEFCGIKCTNIKILYTILSGRAKKTTSAMALMDWSFWRHCK